MYLLKFYMIIERFSKGYISECNCISQCAGTFKSSKIINTHYHVNCATSHLSKSTPSQEQETNKNPAIFAQKIMNIPYFDIEPNKYININIDSEWPTSSTKLLDGMLLAFKSEG